MLNESLEEVAEFKEYIKPIYNPISEKYSTLTGITNEMVEDSPSFEEGMLHFFQWCEEKSQGNSYIIYAWSENDYRQFVNELELKGISKEPFRKILIKWRDLQREYSDMLGIEREISLEVAVSSIEESFQGKMHDALWDARNTAMIFNVSRDEEKFNRVMKPLIELMKPSEELTYTLGDMFHIVL